MRTIDIKQLNNGAIWTIAALGNVSIDIDIPIDAKISACDVHVICNSADTQSKDVTFSLRNLNTQYEIFAFWDDSTEVLFTDMYKLLNKNYDKVRMTILNNHAVNNLRIEHVFVRFYEY